MVRKSWVFSCKWFLAGSSPRNLTEASEKSFLEELLFITGFE